MVAMKMLFFRLDNICDKIMGFLFHIHKEHPGYVPVYVKALRRSVNAKFLPNLIGLIHPGLELKRISVEFFQKGAGKIMVIWYIANIAICFLDVPKRQIQTEYIKRRQIPRIIMPINGRCIPGRKRLLRLVGK